MLDRKLPIGAWWIPGSIELDVEGDRLIWERSGEPQARVVHPSPGVLTDFIRLAGGSPSDFLAFARRWGVLALCEHGLPHTHNPAGTEPGRRWMGNGCRPVKLGDHVGDGAYVDDLESWRYLATRVNAIVKLTAQVRRGVVAPLDDWRLATGIPEALARDEYWPEATSSEALIWYPERLAGAVQELIEIGNVEPRIQSTDRGDFVVSFGPGRMAGFADFGGTFAAVATQLAFMMARQDDLAICSGCGEPYSLEVDGRPKVAGRTWCKRCRDAGVPARVRQRDSRARRKAG